MDIHKIVNANGLLRRCMDVVAEGENVNLIEAYKTKMEFSKYVGGDVSDMECVKKVTEFVHRGKDEEKFGTYKEQEHGDSSSYFAYDVFNNVLEGNSKTGNCVGTSQVCAYLLESKGLEVSMLENNYHVLLEARINDEQFAIETTAENGISGTPRKMFEPKDTSKLELTVMNSFGCTLNERGDSGLSLDLFTKITKLSNTDSNVYCNLGIVQLDINNCKESDKNFTKAIKLNEDFKLAYNGRGIIRNIKGEYDLSIKDYTKAIELDEKFEHAYYNRSLSLSKKGEYDLALKDIEKYASFSKENASRTSSKIKLLKIYSKLTKWGDNFSSYLKI